MYLLTVSIKRLIKSNICWPQQPPTEKVPKLNMIVHDSTKKMLFLKHQNKVNFKNLDAFEVLSSAFPGLKTCAAALASAASAASLASIASTALFHQRTSCF